MIKNNVNRILIKNDIFIDRFIEIFKEIWMIGIFEIEKFIFVVYVYELWVYFCNLKL